MRRVRGINVHQFLDGFGVKCRPVSQAREPRPPNVLYGGRIIARMLRRVGPDRTGLIVSCVLTSNPAALYGDVLYAVMLFLNAHRPAVAQQSLKDEFQSIDLLDLRNRAQRLSFGSGGAMSSKPKTLATLIATELLEKKAA